MQFVYEANPARVIFGKGSRAKVGEELDRLGITRAIVLSTPAQAALAGEFARAIRHRAAVVYPGAAMHTPFEVTEAAMDAVRSVNADGILAVGGGSTIGLGKAIAFRTDLPQIAVPTTFAGSEMTPILGQTENGIKTTVRSAKVLPETAVYDSDLVITMPPSLAGTSGMNAMAHSVEALYAQDANPIISMIAQESIRALQSALPRILESNDGQAAWTCALYGAWMAGICLGAVGMALHHKLCHTLGGMFNLDHAGVHALLLPYSAYYNRDALESTLPGDLYELMRKVAPKKSLREFGLSESDLEHAADQAVKNPYYNPRQVMREGILDLLRAAFDGGRPQ